MPYPNKFEDFVKEVRDDDLTDSLTADVVVEKMTKLLASLDKDAEDEHLEEVLGMSVGPLMNCPMDYIEAAFRTLILDLFPGPSYKPLTDELGTVPRHRDLRDEEVEPPFHKADVYPKKE